MLASFVHAEESVDYDALFERALTESNEQIANDLVDAFFADLRTFLKELAFRDAKTKQAVIDLFVSDYITAEQLPKIVSHLSSYQVKLPTQTERDSLQALKSAVVYKRDSLPGEHREFAVLFKEAMTANEAESFGVDRDFARAAIDAPSQMLHLLAKEDAQVQERMLVALWSQYYTLLGTILKEKLTAIRDTEDFTDEELALLDTIVGYYAESPTVTPPSDPDPEELKAWLEKKQPVATEPTETDPPPTQTDPTDPEPTESPDELQKENNDRLWITVSLCFLAGCIGLLIGVLVHQRKET
jgi:hypothetical protein